MTATQSKVPIAVILNELESDLQLYLSGDATLRGRDIVSSFQNVVRLDHGLDTETLPAGMQGIYEGARQRPDIEHKYLELRDRLRTAAGS